MTEGQNNKYLVSKWFEKNTFHSHDFANIETLLTLKQKQGITISLGLPALNEEATVGNVISTIKSELFDRYPLLDEIALIDSASTDRTAEIAKELGITVYQHKDLLPTSGTLRGKGEALWKSLSILKGDIIVWIDTDIKNIHPRFVYGLVGPLLRRPDLMYVKGFYLRPIQMGGELRPVGGGRVTEILARPYLNAFYPELSGLVQPLSGEYAGRRAALEKIPFSVGYGVEVGMLIDLLREYGEMAIGQVDLETRIHRNQKIQDLGRMAFGILQTLFDKLDTDKRIKLQTELNHTLRLVSSKGNMTSLTEQEIVEKERPPISTVPEYQKLRGISPTAEVEESKKVDILVGIPTFNNEKSIGHVIHAVKTGLSKYFPESRALIITSDGGSTDKTNEIALRSFEEGGPGLQVFETRNIRYRTQPYHGIRGKGSAIRTIFEKATEMDAKAVAMVDADLKSITPEWMDLILSPILKNHYDFVAPYYLRHRYDGTITNLIIYPLLKGLFCKNLRQPIGGEFGFSKKAVETYLQKEVWETDVARFGIDIWLTTMAAMEGFKMCQAFLGAKIHEPKDPSVDLSEMLSQVVGVTFNLIGNYKEAWINPKECAVEEFPIFGFAYEAAAEPVHVNLERMHANFIQGVNDLKPILKKILSEELYSELELKALRSLSEFTFNDTVWSRVVYDYAMAFIQKKENPDILLKSLTPLYLGKLAALVQETLFSSTRQAEERILHISDTFVKERDYFIGKMAAGASF